MRAAAEQFCGRLRVGLHGSALLPVATPRIGVAGRTSLKMLLGCGRVGATHSPFDLRKQAEINVSR